MSAQLRRRASTRATALVAVLTLAAALSARPSGAQPSSEGGPLSSAAFDSVRSALNSSDWNVRHGALARINAAYPDSLPAVLPAAVTEPVLALLAREAASGENHEGDESFGEYIVDLVLTGVRTGDARVIPSVLLLDGLGMSSGVAAFVAGQGAAVMPALDAIARTREDRASDVVETYALMYARYGSLLSRADSARVLGRLVAAASHASYAVRSQMAGVAGRGPIPELLPAVADLALSDMAQEDGVYIIRLDAGRVLPGLQRANAALSAGALLYRLTLLTDGACDGAETRLAGQCTALVAYLATAVRSVAAGRAQPAREALDAYQRAVEGVAADRLLPRITAVTLRGNARAVAERL